MSILVKQSLIQTPPASPLLQMNTISQQQVEEDISSSGVMSLSSLDSYNMFSTIDQENQQQLPSPLSPILNNQTDFFTLLKPATQDVEIVQDFNFLIVDDNEINVKILNKILSRAFTSSNQISTTNPLDVMQLAHRTQFDVLFLDIEMPELNGVEIARALRSIPIFDKLCIIAVTSCSSANDIKIYKEVGIDHTIPKPIALNSMEFKKTVLETLEKRRV